MMVRKCDRCGQVYEPYKEYYVDDFFKRYNSQITYSANMSDLKDDTASYGEQEYDLRPECARKFDSFMKGDR